jgi:hypothetical protein
LAYWLHYEMSAICISSCSSKSPFHIRFFPLYCIKSSLVSYFSCWKQVPQFKKLTKKNIQDWKATTLYSVLIKMLINIAKHKEQSLFRFK